MNKTNLFISILIWSFCGIGFTSFSQTTCNSPTIPVTLTVDLTGQEVWDLFGDPDNVMFSVCDPRLANQRIHSFGFDNITIQTLGASWCIDVVIGTTTNPGEIMGVILRPGFADLGPGPCGPYSPADS